MDDALYGLDEIEKKIADEWRKAETFKDTNPEQAVMAARRACEAICRQICIRHNLTEAQGLDEKCALEKLKNLIRKHKLAPPIIVTHIETIQIYGNFVLHNIETCPSGPALIALSEIVTWFFKTFGIPMSPVGSAVAGQCEKYLEIIQSYTASVTDFMTDKVVDGIKTYANAVTESVRDFRVEKVVDEMKNASGAATTAAEEVWKKNYSKVKLWPDQR